MSRSSRPHPELSPERQADLDAHLAEGGRGRGSYLKPFTVVAIVIAACGWMLGAFITLWIPSPEDWWVPATIRVGWQLGGTVLLAVALMLENGPFRALFTAWRVTAVAVGVAILFGLVFCFNPALDLIRGPAAPLGTAELKVRKAHSSRLGTYLKGTVGVRQPDGSYVEVDVRTNGGEEIKARLDACDTREPVRIVMLRHLDQVLAISCRPKPG